MFWRRFSSGFCGDFRRKAFGNQFDYAQILSMGIVEVNLIFFFLKFNNFLDVDLNIFFAIRVFITADSAAEDICFDSTLGSADMILQEVTVFTLLLECFDQGVELMSFSKVHDEVQSSDAAFAVLGHDLVVISVVEIFHDFGSGE